MKVNISGTISKDQRPNCGLDLIGEKVNANQLARFTVVGLVEYHGYHANKGQPAYVTVSFSAIEPLDGEDDATARELLDRARQARGLGSVELTLFDAADEDGEGPWPGDADFKAPGEQPTLDGDQDDPDTAKTEATESTEATTDAKPKRTRAPRKAPAAAFSQ